jgi:hypothetical protein
LDQKNREDYDGVPTSSELYAFTEDGKATFRSGVSEGSTFKMLQGTLDNVLQSAADKLGEAAALPGVNGILAFSCIARRMMVMPTDSLKELNTARETVGGIPFMMGYAGGEICPTSVKDGTAANRYHDYALIIMIL